MKEAIANAGVFNLIIIFVTILILFFIGSLSYSKAFKVKDKIVREIEKNQDFDCSEMKDGLEQWLGEIGYRYKSGVSKCNENGGVVVPCSSVYDFCVYEHNFRTSQGVSGKYYSVTAYMYFELPIVRDLFKIPVRGETTTFISNVDG